MSDPRQFIHNTIPHSIEDKNTPHRTNSTAKICLAYQWQCANLECINANYLCDGNIDCLDNSDELPDNCLGEGNVISFVFINQFPQAHPPLS